MKKLIKLQINSNKLMNNDELINLRGGYDFGWVNWYIGSTSCANNPVATCDGDGEGSARWFCNRYCPGWTNFICAGG